MRETMTGMNETAVTTVNDATYTELMQDTPEEPNEELRAAAKRARTCITRVAAEADV